VFLKCWVGAHVRDNGGSANTVYFDAFKEDYLDDPLVSLVRTVSKRIEGLTPDNDNDESEKTRVQKLKESVRKAKVFAPALGRAALRLGVAAGTAGLIRNINDIAESVLDEAAKQGAKELDNAIGTFWQAEEARADAMEGFRTYLTDLAAEQKLIIVVDELDRCRPDYALNLLEVIKHFFNVPNVHFVLGVNLTELQNSVRARYGAGVNAGLYLQKFVTVTMRLHDQESTLSLKKSYFEKLCNQFGMQQNGPFHIASTYLNLASDSSSTTLRGLQHFTRSLIISPSCWDEWGDRKINRNKEILRVGLLFLNAFYPQLISRLKQEQLTYEDVAKVLHLPDPREANGSKEQTTVAWMLCFQSQGDLGFFEEYYQSNTNTMLGSFDYSTLIYLWDNYASAFQLSR